MYQRLAIVLLVFVAVATAQTMVGQQNQAPARNRPPGFGPPEGWPDRHPVPEALPQAGPRPLPKPSITEPFAIGEALHDPARVEDAVVSLLALMDIGIVADNLPMSPVPGRGRLRLPESEARALIEMGTTDAEAQGQDPSGPSTFKDLHTALSAVLPDFPVERLAEAYTAEYARRPDSVAPQVLMGRPLEPDTPLLRTELWMLLVDGLAPQRTVRRAASLAGPRLIRANMVLNQNPGDWLPFPTPGADLTNAEWREMVMRLPLLANEHSLIMNDGEVHEGHGGSGTPLTIEARLTGTPRPVVSSVTGRTLLMPRAGATLAGLRSHWSYYDDARRHGTMNIASDDIVEFGADGAGRAIYTPKPERANGRGELMSESFDVTVILLRRNVVDRLYVVPAGFASMSFNELWPWGSLKARNLVDVKWHGDAIKVKIKNDYDVGSTIPLLGSVTRFGVDQADGTLELEEDGNYRGTVRLRAGGFAEVAGMACSPRGGLAEQYAEVIGTPIERNASAMVAGFYNTVHLPQHYRWLRGQPDSYLRLEFFPKTRPVYQAQDPCQELVRRPGFNPDQSSNPISFIPLNDAQWTVPNTGYAIGVPKAGETLSYEDRTSENATIIPGVKLGKLLKAESIWYVTVSRPKSN